jgi:ParB family transcriptional regulator, chromosome partitioning protein
LPASSERAAQLHYRECFVFLGDGQIELRRAEESVLRSVLVETTIVYMSTRHNPAQVLSEAAAVYKVDTDAIALKVKQEFVAKEEKIKKTAQPSAKATKKVA